MKEATDDDVSASTTTPVAPESWMFATSLMAPAASLDHALSAHSLRRAPDIATDLRDP